MSPLPVDHDERFILAVAEDSKLWRTSDIVGTLLGLSRSLEDAPWHVKIAMRQWNAAITTAIQVFSSGAIIRAEGNARKLARDLSNDWEEELK